MQTAMIELDPIAGRLITPITAEMFAVYVPVQAMDKLANDDDDNAGITEILRRRMLAGEVLFPMEEENEVTMRLGVMPKSIGGKKLVSTVARYAYICAINFLRQRKYTYATLLPKMVKIVTPALLSNTALDRFNAVLNPDDFINGSLNFTVGANQKVKVDGVTKIGTGNQAAEAGVVAATATSVEVAGVTGGKGVKFAAKGDVMDLNADLSGLNIGGISLTDFYNAQTMDRITRTMRAIVEANPIDGEEQLVRWAHGLSVDTDANPFMIYATEQVFGQELRNATDGAGMENEISQSRMMLRMSFNVPVPKTELGGVVITFLTVKPDETILEQPHPILSEPWVQENQVADELMLDPQPVTAREVQAGVPQASEGTVCFYTGHNEIKRLYVNYGFNRHLDPTTVEAKTAIWQIAVPASVTPGNIVYPNELDHYPFLDQDAEVATYMLRSEAVIGTPMFFGPSPVEEVGIIRDEGLFQPNADEGGAA